MNPRVLMFGWELPPHNSGGLGVACYGLTKGLSQQGVPIAFALPRRLPIHIPFMEVLSHSLEGVQLTAINSLLQSYLHEQRFSETYSDLLKEELVMYGNDLYQEAHRFGEMAAHWANKQSHDIIHAHDWMTYPAAMKAREVSKKPFVAHIHATEFDRTGGSVNELIADLEYQGLNKADAVIAVSQYTKEVVQKHYGVSKDKIYVVHNGVDLNEFKPHQIKSIFPHDQVVLFVGRLTFQKGVEYVLKAAQKVLKTNPNTIFLIVGHGDMYQELILKAASLGIANKVVFPGFLKGTQLQACYDMADLFVMPSVSEPYGIVALEALAAGTPAIISKQSGVSESIDHVLKVDFWDTEKMASMITTLLDYPELAKELATEALNEASNMSWDKAAKEVVQVYKQVT